MKVYKYLKFDDGAKCILKDGTLKFTSPANFNDPFDCRSTFNNELALQFYYKKYLDRFLDDHRHLSPAKRLLEIKKFKESIKNKIKNGVLSEHLLSGIGVCCFTTDPESVLMWSHYADHHRGFVIEFDVIDVLSKPTEEIANKVDNPEFNLFMFEVAYSDNMPIRTFINESPRDIIYQNFLTKASGWKYENEYRCISHHKGAGIHKFDTSLVTAVYAGVRMSDEDFSSLQRLVNDFSILTKNKISLRKAKMVDGKYKLSVL
ncbi:DUF2971 domain-containing protein [Aeromonas veronii]|uniref:DUF2971 domain-containing protein n=1 Tax=Aeromonas veronii TaxID=654 RepID=UPI003B9EA096